MTNLKVRALSQAEIDEINRLEIERAHGEDEDQPEYDLDFIAESEIEGDLYEWHLNTKAVFAEMQDKSYIKGWKTLAQELAALREKYEPVIRQMSPEQQERLRQKLQFAETKRTKQYLKKYFPTYLHEYMPQWN